MKNIIHHNSGLKILVVHQIEVYIQNLIFQEKYNQIEQSINLTKVKQNYQIKLKDYNQQISKQVSRSCTVIKFNCEQVNTQKINKGLKPYSLINLLIQDPCKYDDLIT
ncbi:hypothetical protein ABPG74_007314 [Tetrahymena malaccensis]